MVYTEAKELMDKHLNLIGTESKLKTFPFKIKLILIAPKNKLFEDRIDILNKILLQGISNEDALRKLGFLYSNLDVYIIGNQEVQNKKEGWYELYNYLSEIGHFS